MSRSNIQAFREELKKNKALRAKIKAIPRRDKAAALKQLVGVAGAAGFTFTVEEARTLIKPAARELSMADLEQVSGGGEDGFSCIWGDEEPQP
jgi:predicted ribosomally synthesized peptide with nif11-like leader